MRLKRRTGEAPLAGLLNLGPKSAAILKEAGIGNADDLRKLGAVAAYARAKARHPDRVSLNLLWALAAGLDGRDWRDLTAAEKDRLKEDLRRSGW
jgi:DNA transformation protein and related proteins